MKRFVALAIIAILCGAVAGTVVTFSSAWPDVEALETWTPSLPSRLLDRHGRELKTLYEENRVWTPYSEISEHMIQAIVAIEDRDFWEHTGQQYTGILRAFIVNLQSGETVQGGSTITEQLAKQLFLTTERSYRRRATQALIALQIESRYTKEKILELYLNQIYFGSGNYGIGAAAMDYFGVPPGDLTLEQAALLAGLPKAPSMLSPRVDPAAALKRRTLVLNAMAETGAITAREAQTAAQVPLELAQPEHVSNAPWMVELVRKRLDEVLGEEVVVRGGLTIHTTLDLQWQQAAETALDKGIDRLVRRELGSPADAIPFAERPQGAVTIVDATDGSLRTIVGGSSYAASSYNRAVQARRQTGSAFKPILYSLAIHQGMSQAATIFDAPKRYGTAAQPYEPANYDHGFRGQVTLRRALEKSLNVPTVRLMQRLGPRSVAEHARRMGIDSPIGLNLSSALGSSELSLLELTGAYAVFAGGGLRHEIRLVDRVIGPDGQTLYQDPVRSFPVLTPAEAAIMADMLKGVVDHGTGWRARAVEGIEVGVKTGTTSNYRDAWYVGITPEVACGVWMGYDNNRSLGRGESGSRVAGPVWVDSVKAIADAHLIRRFPRPDGTTLVRIDPLDGRPSPKGRPMLLRQSNVPETSSVTLDWSERDRDDLAIQDLRWPAPELDPPAP